MSTDELQNNPVAAKLPFVTATATTSQPVGPLSVVVLKGMR